jgi:glyoxylase-like metal-dependent hydrolase (beta-lactamase superfamily II)
MDEPRAPGEQATPSARLVLAPNAGPMTLDGTNSYVVAAPGSSGVIVVDPGPADDAHLARLAGFGPVELVLVTHHHADHVAGLDVFHRMTDAPVRAVDPAFCFAGEPLGDSELIRAAGLELHVMATPGHTADSVCFVLPDDGEYGSVLTGDTILGRGTSIIADPDGALGPYLESLGRLKVFAGSAGGMVAVLPGHGPVLRDLGSICDDYLVHRADRLEQVRRALAQLGADASVSQVTDLVYADTDAAVRPAAEASVRAQLVYLRGQA